MAPILDTAKKLQKMGFMITSFPLPQAAAAADFHLEKKKINVQVDEFSSSRMSNLEKTETFEGSLCFVCGTNLFPENCTFISEIKLTRLINSGRSSGNFVFSLKCFPILCRVWEEVVFIDRETLLDLDRVICAPPACCCFVVQFQKLFFAHKFSAPC